MSKRARAVAPMVPSLAAVLVFASALIAPECSLGNTCPGSGALDPSFGIGGKVTTGFGLITAEAVAIQADGKVVVAGWGSGVNIQDFALARYNHDGSLDTSFGTGGLVRTDFGLGDIARDVAVQADGKILVAGSAVLPTSPGIAVALARYNPDGSLDPSFGIGGKVTTNIRSFDESLAIQVDGKIVVAVSDGEFALARFNSDGSLDASFGTDGLVTTEFGSAPSVANAVVIQTDGKIVVVGTSFAAVDFAMARYDVDGNLDMSFGAGGKVTTNFAGEADEARAVTLQTDGRIVVVGSAAHFTNEVFGESFGLARYNTDGSLDSSFGVAGKAIAPFDGVANGVVTQVDGKIVAAGGRDFRLARYTVDGSLDMGFGTGGFVVADFLSSSGANDVTIQADGRIVAVGEGHDGFALARYHATSACERIELLIADVQGLVGSGALTQQQGNGLIAKLEEATKVLEKQNVNPAIRKLGDFIDQVESYVMNGKLTLAEGQPLIDAANAIMQSLAGSIAKVTISDERATWADRYALAQNSPNPFNPRTTIRLSLPRATEYTLSIYDVAGRVQRKYSGHAGPGEVSLVWDGRNAAGVRVASGVYFYEARAGAYSETRKMVLSK